LGEYKKVFEAEKVTRVVGGFGKGKKICPLCGKPYFYKLRIHYGAEKSCWHD
jgi:hypothetical protein